MDDDYGSLMLISQHALKEENKAHIFHTHIYMYIPMYYIYIYDGVNPGKLSTRLTKKRSGSCASLSTRGKF